MLNTAMLSAREWYPTRAHQRFSQSQSGAEWEETLAYAAAHPDEMIMRNEAASITALEMGMMSNIPTWAIERCLADHARGPHAAVDIFGGTANQFGSYLFMACTLGCGPDFIRYVAARRPAQLLAKSRCVVMGGFITPFTALLNDNYNLDKTIIADIRKVTIAEKKRQISLNLHVTIKLCMSALTKTTPRYATHTLAALPQALFVHHVLSTFQATGMGLQAERLLALVGVSDEEAEAACLADGDIGAFRATALVSFQ
jgi:hypothetical protein